MTDSIETKAFGESPYQNAEQAQRLAADPDHSAWVEANAGSGKTKVLIDRVARLLLQRPDGRPGSEPDSILCITYTKAAANEMLSRLFERLGRWSTQNDEELRKTLAELENRSPQVFDRQALDRARSLFARALETPGGLRIETIHAFCARILRRFPLEAGIPPGFSELDDEAADKLWRICLEDHLEAEAIKSADSFKLVSDAAGGRGVDFLLEQLRSNRTPIQRFQRTLRKRGVSASAAIRHALEVDASSSADLIARTMTDALPRAAILSAIQDIWQVVDPKPDKDKTNKRFASSLQSILDDPDLERAFAAYVRLLAGSKLDWSLKGNPYSGKALEQGQVADLYRRKPLEGYPEGVEISRLRAADQRIRTAKIAEQTIALARLGLPIVEAYQKAKHELGALDFDDLIQTTRSLFVERAAAEWVLYKLDGGLSHILLDEAQDTSPDQWELINAIAAEFDAGLGAKADAETRTKFVVGDPKQSIYSFQGADQDAFAEQRAQFATTTETSESMTRFPEMTMSFRSTPEVLSFVDAVRDAVPLESASTSEFAPASDALVRHEANRITQSGRVELWPLIMPEANPIESNWEAPVDHVAQGDPVRRLAEQIAAEIQGIIKRGDPIWFEGAGREWQQRPATPGDVLILVRRRSAMFKTLIGALEARNLPVAGADRLWLNDNLAVQDCLNLMRFALQPGDDLTLAEILRGPFVNLSDDDHHLFPLAFGRGEGETLWARLQGAEAPEFQPAKAFCAGLLLLKHIGPFSFLSQILEAPDAFGKSGFERLIQRFGEPARNPIEELVSRALKQEQSESISLQTFLANMDAEDIELKRELGEAGDTIRVMTVHGAKGLQAPIVILPETTSGTRKTKSVLFFTEDGVPLFSPSGAQDCDATAALRQHENDAQERESRRLLYVALTRAQDRLIICGAGLKRPESGFETSSWYRWCLRGMGVAQGLAPFEAAADDILSIGEPLDSLGGGAVNMPVAIDRPGWLDQPPPQPSVAVPSVMAPSKMMSGIRPSELDLSETRRAGLRRGALIHTVLHRLAGVQPDKWSDAMNAYLSRLMDLSEAERRDIETTVANTLAVPEIRDLLTGPGRSEAAVIGKLPDGQLVSGRVDRLCETEDSILIIDFKSDHPSITEIDEGYLLQMAAYSQVIQTMYPYRKVSAALLYTRGPSLHWLDGSDLSERLNRRSKSV